MAKRNKVQVHFDYPLSPAIEGNEEYFEIEYDEPIAPGQGTIHTKYKSNKIEQVPVIVRVDKYNGTGEVLTGIDKVDGYYYNHTTVQPINEKHRQADLLDLKLSYTGQIYSRPITEPLKTKGTIAGGRGGDGGGANVSAYAVGAKGALLSLDLSIPSNLVGQKLIILPGRGAYSSFNPDSSGDAATGSGGGASYLAVTRTDLPLNTEDLSQGISYTRSGFPTEICPVGTAVQLIACAAGGGGGDDSRYASHMAVGGLASEIALRNVNVGGVQSGSGFATVSSSNISRSLLDGGSGTSYVYQRGGGSWAGFGGGGGNTDDAYGGSGGGASDSAATVASASYTNPLYCTVSTRTDNGNIETNGFIEIQKAGVSDTFGTIQMKSPLTGKVQLVYDVELPVGASLIYKIDGVVKDMNAVNVVTDTSIILVELHNPSGANPIKFRPVAWTVVDDTMLARSLVISFPQWYNNALQPPVIRYLPGGSIRGTTNKAVQPFEKAIEPTVYDYEPNLGLQESWKLGLTKTVAIFHEIYAVANDAPTENISMKALVLVKQLTPITFTGTINP